MTKDSRPSISTLLILLGIFLLLGYELSKWSVTWFRTPPEEQRVVTPRGDLAEDEKATIELFKRASPSVVYITTVATGIDLRTMNVLEMPRGTGSGFIWDDAGDIVTNFHVLAGAGVSGAKVTLANHKTYDAVVVGVAPEYDLAVLRINAPKEELVPIVVGSSEDLQVGQKVFAIGNPFGLDQTLTTGVISALGRTILSPSPSRAPITNVIQTDAAINPGNSGGPLLDSAGRLIGVNTQIVDRPDYAGGIGFAIPVDTVNRIVTQLIATGRVAKPYLGIHTIESVSQNLTRRLGVRGVLVIDVEPGSPAAEAGIRPTRRLPDGSYVWGDIIVRVAGQDVSDIEEIHRVVQVQQIGSTIQVEVLRPDGVVSLDVRLTERR